MEKILVKNDDKHSAEKPVYISVTPTVHYGGDVSSPELAEKVVNFKKFSTVAPTLLSLG